MVCEALAREEWRDMHRRARWKDRRETTPLKELVKKLDLTQVKRKIMHPKHGLGWSQQHADEVEVMYKNFLVLAGVPRSGKRTVPFGDIDEMWHYHILDTAKYRDDCEMLFGYYLDHYPYFGLNGPEDEAALEAATKDTQKRYVAMFGPYPSTVEGCAEDSAFLRSGVV